MSVRVRFAPSPTGYLHIGGARTALYCYLYAKAMKGQFVLRIEDTDQERSKPEYEMAMIDDIHWCGLDYDEGPDKPADVGPYRQSERMDLYKKLAWELVEKGHAYPCFLKSEELEELTNKAQEEKISPHAYHGKYRDLDKAEAKAKVDAGEEFVIRFKNPKKKYTFTDLVRGEVTFPEDMVGDFVILRSNGMPVYNFCCVVDDWKMQMTHVIRAEEHLNNTVRQLMIYEGLGAKVPEFAHCSLLVGEDRQKLSKRHGATSVSQYRDQNYLPTALMNYLCLLGWSHPEEQDIFKIDDIADIFDLTRFNKSPALYDVAKLNFFNGQHLKLLTGDELLKYCEVSIPTDHSFHSQEKEWKIRCLEFFKEKVNLPSELSTHFEVLFNTAPTISSEDREELKDILTWESTPIIQQYLKAELEKLKAAGVEYPTEEHFNEWSNHIKKELKIKGKQLFKGMRAAFTHMTQGPDLKVVIPLTNVELLLTRFQ
tara:strand:+ start:60931 stop:62379 length:1449 start_codon:yes stop_codon:yes gene_type:complete